VAIGFGYTWQDLMWWIFLFWTFITGVYVIYDLRYMEIPDQIMVPTLLITLMLILIGLWDESFVYMFDFPSYTTFHTFLTDHVSSAIYIYSFFFLQIIIPGTIFLLKTKNYRHIFELFLSYFTFPVSTVYDFFSRSPRSDETPEFQIPTWIGG
jgi:hypothetical protein